MPFDPATPTGPPSGRYRTVHYGVMVANLPAPFRLLDVIAVIGQPRIPIWRNDHLIRTTAEDTVSLLTATGAMTSGQLTGYSIAEECDFRGDGSPLRFGDDFVLEGRYPHFRVHRDHPEVSFDLRLTASDKVTHFARLLGGVYDHWSLLCEYEGSLEGAGSPTPVAGLCTLEYARGAPIRLPLRLFTYHILNVDDRTQVLMGKVLGPGGLAVQEAVYVRSLDDYSQTFTRGFEFTVGAYDLRRTPDGRTMRLPKQFSWRVEDADGRELVHIDATSNGDFTYGMAAGYAGSCEYSGRFRGRSITGTGYLEYIDGR